MALVTNRQISTNSQSWLGAVDVGYLTESERDAILDVLQRDESVRQKENNRISVLKSELRDVRRKGAKRAENSYSTRICARCNNKTGIIFNSAAQCPICKHKVCQQCRMTGIFSKEWKCVVCYQEAKLKAETGEWFYGLMRPELRSMQDGPTLVKQAVNTKPIHFDQRSDEVSNHSKSAPEITCTPASSSISKSSKRDTVSLNSFDTEDTGSSTESRKQRSKRGRLGPAETGSIGELRRPSPVRHTRSGSPHGSPTLSPRHRRTNTLPSTSNTPPGPAKPPRIADLATIMLANKKKQQQQEQLQHTKPEVRRQYSGIEEINTQPFLLLPRNKAGIEMADPANDDRYSEHDSISSAESKSIDGVFEEYISQKQREEQRQNSALTERSDSHYSSNSSLSSKHTRSHKSNHSERYLGETEDQISQLPEPRVSTLPRRLNEKLLRQNKLSVSVPTVYEPTKHNRTSQPGLVETAKSSKVDDNHSNTDHESMDYSLAMNRDLSTSVPNLTKSTTSLNSVGHHDLPITGEIKFSLNFNYKTNILLVNIVECRNIAMADKRRKRSDPYVKAYLLPDKKNKQKTDVKKRTTDPKYNKCLKFSVNHSELSTRVLELSVWHAGTFTRNLFLGQVQLPLDTWNWDSTNQNWFPLRQREAINADFVRDTIYKGDLIVGLKFVSPGSMTPGKHKPPFGELNVLIKQAKNLTPVRSNGTVDAYVKIMLQPDKQFRQKTPVIPKNASPEWNYNIRMQLYQPMEESGLQLSIWHRDKLQGSTFLGGSRLNLGKAVGEQKWLDAEGVERELWLSAINSPDQWVDGKLSLRPSM
uniref:synaptotagmin-like protein 4 isoform X1 n=1 Tax=Styela clava TaxID=7725 RepID=UPI00193A6D43|nr:synaptotagmin-like protein 4 isoform X1 [Styela clava]